MHGQAISTHHASMSANIREMLEQSGPYRQKIHSQTSILQLILEPCVVRPPLHRPDWACFRCNGYIPLEIGLRRRRKKILLPGKVQSQSIENQFLIGPPVLKLEFISLGAPIDTD